MIRTLAFFATVAALSAQPNAFTRVDLYPTGATPAYLRLFEVRANGSNHVAIQAADSIASDCTYRISEVAFLPCFPNQIDLGSSSQRFKKLWSQDADVGALTVGGLAGFAGNISFSGSMSPLFTNLGSIGVSSLRYASGFINAISSVTVAASTSLTTPDILISPLASTAPGAVRFQERAVNGINFAQITASDSIGSDYTYVIGDVEFRPGTNNAADLGGASNRWKKLWTQDADVNGAFQVGGNAGFAGNISFSGTATPLFSGLGSLGTASLPYGTVNGLNVVAQSTFRLGASATAGRVLTTDSNGFGTWQPAPSGITSINGFTNSAQSISIGASGSAPNIGSSGGIHTVNIPQAAQFTEGTVTTGTQTFGGAKTFSGAATFNSTVSISGNMSAANGTFSSIVNPGNYSPGFDGIGSIGLSGTRVGDVFSYRGNFASTLQASGLSSLLGGLNVTGTSTFSGSIQFDSDLLRNIGSSGVRANDVFMNRSRAVTYFYNGTVGLTGTVTAGTCILTFTSGGLTSTAGAC